MIDANKYPKAARLQELREQNEEERQRKLREQEKADKVAKLKTAAVICTACQKKRDVDLTTIDKAVGASICPKCGGLETVARPVVIRRRRRYKDIK